VPDARRGPPGGLSRHRDALVNLSFAIVAASAAASAIGDMVILQAQTPEI